ncbi:MAG TPA: hypothetical protein VLG10_06930 [Methylomirabilota bacterium]|nr:hypothetical protein [Methylomirabilota bacterium]
MTRPPLIVVFVAVVIIALGMTAGAVMSQLRPETERYAQARIRANAAAHGLAGSPEYDDEIVARAVFTAEAGVSFLHTHAMGLGPIVLLTATIAANTVPAGRRRRLLYALLAVGGLFPCGYLVYALAVLEAGRDAGVRFTESWVLTPLGSVMILGLLILAVLLVGGRRSPPTR